MAMRGTKPKTIKKFMRGDKVCGYSRFFYRLSDGATADKATIVILRDDGLHGERDMKRIGYISASVVDTEITFDETSCGTQSLTVIKQVEQYLLDLLVALGKADTMTEPRTAPAPAEDDGHDVLVIPISKVHELVGKNINGYKILGVDIFFNGSYHLVFVTDSTDTDSTHVFGCDIEVINE